MTDPTPPPERWALLREEVCTRSVQRELDQCTPQEQRQIVESAREELDAIETAKFGLRTTSAGALEKYQTARDKLDDRVYNDLDAMRFGVDPSSRPALAAMRSPHWNPPDRPPETPDLSPRSSQVALRPASQQSANPPGRSR
ncbi:hypothetical protein ABT336_18145 [Micromonospora sp. NPDC000207]|uniref:hypothetical protein n=1 Tax=Micromonospora sp. NPDC000207 TaxID=3154246 RepID=UPI003327845D